MAPDTLTSGLPPEGGAGAVPPPRCGVVDLGSNSVRLVVFEGRGRNPQAIFNEKAVLGREPFRAAMRQADAVFMQGDWTNVDPAISEFLEAHQAVGVPLYVVFPSDGGEGEVLPTVLTQDIVAKALARARR